MKVYRLLDSLPGSQKGRVVAIGFFDGVHVGHQRLIMEMVKLSKKENLDNLVITFDPHPLNVIGCVPPIKLLTDLGKKMELISALEVDNLLVLPFTHKLSKLTPGEFSHQILRDGLNTKSVFVGYNFTFGSGGTGSAATLDEIGRKAGFRVYIIDPVRVDGTAVSSTHIRDLIAKGYVDLASAMLGRMHSVMGKVVKGYSRGRSLGFPTANLDISDNHVLPLPGVYVVIAKFDGIKRGGIANLGERPTFGGKNLGLEAHLFDFDGDIYSHEVEISFMSRLRDERCFSSALELQRQISLDSSTARTILGN